MPDMPKLDTWMEEPVEVPSFQAVVNKKGDVVGIEKGTTTKYIKTIYSKVEPKKMSCADRQHFWVMTDKHRHIASCRNCTKNRFLRAVYEAIKEGHIIDRETGILID